MKNEVNILYSQNHIKLV